MKKMKFMRIAAVMMILCLASTCAISGTFAKYTTSVTSQDSARVAKWGIGENATLNITDLFKKAYINDEVKSDSDIIAPGTTNSASFTFSTDSEGAPEVAYEIKVEVSGEIDPTLVANTNIQWSLDGGAWGTYAQLTNAIKALSGDASGTKQYAPNTAPTALNGNHTISWQWVFETADNTETTDKNEMDVQDKVDTALGNADSLAEVSLTIVITATQLDTYPAP